MRQLRNYTEEAVKLYIDKWYSEAEICQCDDCRLDVMAIMLNKMEPHYVVTDTGALYAQMNDFDPQYKADMMTNMELAILTVNQRPRHARQQLTGEK